MYVFGYDTKMAGCFVAFPVNTQAGRGAWLAFPPSSDKLPTNDWRDPFIVTGVSFAQKEKYQLVECYQEVVHTYAFGHNPQSSMITVNFTGFITAYDGAGISSLFFDMLGTYQNRRLSKNPNRAEVYIGRSLLKGYLVGMGSATSNVDFNLQSFTMELLATEVLGQ